MSNTNIILLKSDITKLNVDVIVNAANSKLAGGGGVDGAIHRAAGPELLKACQKLNGCHTGNAKITKAYDLPCKYVIHTVGPVWHGGTANETELLKSCYSISMELAINEGLKSIAFPNISTGIYGFPKDAAADIAVNIVMSFIGKDPQISEVYFVCFDDENYNIYNELLQRKNLK